MRANPDGYTILMGHIGTHAFSVSLYPNLAYRPDADFKPIGTLIETHNFVARKDFPAKDLKEFMAYVKANAEKLNTAHAGVGSNSYGSYPISSSSFCRIACLKLSKPIDSMTTWPSPPTTWLR
jgi:tripartite-type tricarboxylate transporter receptor subunit TctC